MAAVTCARAETAISIFGAPPKAQGFVATVMRPRALCRMTLTALPMTSAGRFSPLGPRGDIPPCDIFAMEPKRGLPISNGVPKFLSGSGLRAGPRFPRQLGHDNQYLSRYL